MTEQCEYTYTGIDVSAERLNLAIQREQGYTEREFPNDRAGVEQLARMLASLDGEVRVSIEATSTYHRRAAFELHSTPDVEVMVQNPRGMSHFMTASKQRSKTDVSDARMIADYGARMEFTPWRPPGQQADRLVRISRRIGQLVDKHVSERNQEHAIDSEPSVPDEVEASFPRVKQHLEEMIAELTEAAERVIHSCPELTEKFELLQTVTGIDRHSAVLLLGELSLLPDGLEPKQWVAWAGLDPVVEHSGKDDYSPPRISKQGSARLRHYLYMPAMSAISNEEAVREFRDVLVEQRDKEPIVAVVAVMRKLLHCIWGMFKHREPFDPERFYNPAEDQKTA